jgi:hypothetical protein
MRDRDCTVCELRPFPTEHPLQSAHSNMGGSIGNHVVPKDTEFERSVKWEHGCVAQLFPELILE